MNEVPTFGLRKQHDWEGSVHLWIYHEVPTAHHILTRHPQMNDPLGLRARPPIPQRVYMSHYIVPQFPLMLLGKVDLVVGNTN